MCLNSILCVKRLSKKRVLSLLWSRRLLNPDPGLLQTLRDFAISFSGSRTHNLHSFIACGCRISPLLYENSSRAVPCVIQEERLENEMFQQDMWKMGQLLCAKNCAGCSSCILICHVLVSSSLDVISQLGWYHMRISGCVGIWVLVNRCLWLGGPASGLAC